MLGRVGVAGRTLGVLGLFLGRLAVGHVRTMRLGLLGGAGLGVGPRPARGVCVTNRLLLLGGTTVRSYPGIRGSKRSVGAGG